MTSSQLHDRTLLCTLGDLNGGADADVAALSVPLLRSEAVNSSRIEGMMSSHRRVVDAAVDPAGARRQALETVRNIDAMRKAMRLWWRR
jgi:hypothetical protein